MYERRKLKTDRQTDRQTNNGVVCTRQKGTYLRSNKSMISSFTDEGESASAKDNGIASAEATALASAPCANKYSTVSTSPRLTAI